MLKKALFAIVRWAIFLVATITAVLLAFAVTGVVFTTLKWATDSETAALTLMALLCGTIAGLFWFASRRTTKERPTGRSGKAFAGWATGLSALVILIGWMMSRFHITSPLTVLCLRPVGGLAAPLLISALSDDEADTDAQELLMRHPDATLRQLPRLEDLIIRNPPGARHGHTQLVDARTGKTFAADPFAATDAIEIIAGLGPKAAAAAPTLVKRVPIELADEGESGWYPTHFDFLDSRLTREAWVALSRMGPAAVPAVIDGLKSATDFRERLVLANVLRHIGSDIEPASPVLIAILTDQAQGPSRDECIERVLWTLNTLGPAAQDAVPVITPWALDAQHPHARSAITTLGHLGNASNGVVQTLLKILEDSDWEGLYSLGGDKSRQQLAVEALGQIGLEAAVAIPRLRELGDTAESRDVLEKLGYANRQSEACIRALARIGPEGLQEVVKLLSGPYSIAAVDAIAGLGPAGHDAAPALREALSKATPSERVRLAMAIDAVEGPSDEIVAVMGEYFDLSEQDRAAIGSDLSLKLVERFGELGSKAKAAVPPLTKLLSQPGSSDRWKTARALWSIDPGIPAIRPAVVEMLNDESASIWHRLDPKWLVELDPTGEQVVPALAEVVAKSDDNDSDAVRALLLYGKRARPALPAVLAASNEGRFGGGLTVEYLWGLSTWDVVRYSFYSFEGTVVAIFIFCGACLIVECFLRFRRRRVAPSEPQQVT
jgi:HEAT repeat protein